MIASSFVKIYAFYVQIFQWKFILSHTKISHTKILGPSKSQLKLVKRNYKQSPTASKATAETR